MRLCEPEAGQETRGSSAGFAAVASRPRTRSAMKLVHSCIQQARNELHHVPDMVPGAGDTR